MKCSFYYGSWFKSLKSPGVLIASFMLDFKIDGIVLKIENVYVCVDIKTFFF